MKGSLGNLMKQAQDMQANMEKAQAEIAQMELSGESGGGMVRIVMTGRHDVKRVTIDPVLLAGDDKEMLEDLIAAAVNDAVQRVELATKDKMQGLTAGLNLPAGLKLPF
jgi:hypothetical protein